jgi:hypothetical protein
MNLYDFSVWLAGYEATFTGGAPNAEQWEVVKRRLDLVHIYSGAVHVPVPVETRNTPVVSVESFRTVPEGRVTYARKLR